MGEKRVFSNPQATNVNEKRRIRNNNGVSGANARHDIRETVVIKNNPGPDVTGRFA